MNQTGYTVVQLGARMHYAVPRILHGAGRLDALFTDARVWGPLGRGLRALPARLRPRPVARWLSRYPEGVPGALVHSFPRLAFEYQRRLRSARTHDETTNAHLWVGRAIGERVLRRAGEDLGAVYTFNSAGLALLEAGRAKGGPACVEQCSCPRLVERALIIEEAKRHPDWESAAQISAADIEYAAIEKREWAAATRILCPSAFVHQALLEAGAPAAAIRVVPYGVDAPRAQAAGCGKRSGAMAASPLKVLTAGRVGLQKGSPYVYECAGLLSGAARFRMVGSSAGVPERILARLRERIEMVGAVPRSHMQEQYAWADVYLQPSLCEGSATVSYEALACGLPVICTPNTGSVIRDGVDGFIVPPRDAVAIAERLERLASDPELLRSMSAQALCRAEEFTVAQYGRRLLAALG